MKSIQNILVPYDFSPEALIGLKAACSYAIRFQSKIHLAHNIKPEESKVLLHPKDAVLENADTLHHLQLEKQANEALVELRKTSDELVPETIQGITHITTGTFPMLLDEVSKKVDLDLIVTGTDGSRNFFDLLSGNDTEKMIRNTDVPIIAVSDSEEVLFDNILIATDLGKTIPSRIFELCRFLQEQGAILHFVNIISTNLISNEEVEERIKAVAKWNGINDYYSHVVRNSNEVDGIQAIAKKINADLILMKTYEKSKVSALISGSIAEKMVRNTDVPVMVESVAKK
ncbi:MAG: universal stress protein [Cyclobacteriaceae bacterium]